MHRNTRHTYKKLPFYCCSLALTPFGDDVVCTKDGHAFSILNIIPYIKKHKKNPARPPHARPPDHTQASRGTRCAGSCTYSILIF